MGLFSPRYPTGAEPPKRESRADRKSREAQEQRSENLAARVKAADRASKERGAALGGLRAPERARIRRLELTTPRGAGRADRPAPHCTTTSTEENPMPNHQSTRDYIAARQAGDGDRASQIVTEVVGRFSTRTTDGSEIAEVLEANFTVPLAEN